MGRPGSNSCNFAAAMRLPVKVNAPTTTSKSKAVSLTRLMSVNKTNSACLVGIAEFVLFTDINRVKLTALDFEVVVGALTFTGSLIAAAKLQELLPGRPITYKGQNFLSIATIGIVAAIGIFLVVGQTQSPLFYVMVGLAFLFGL